MTLQAVLVVLLAAGAAFAYGMGTFTTTQIKDELTSQQIFFPGADQIKAGGSLDPATFPQEIRDQAGNQLTDGNQARIYANDFLGEHLKNVAGGLTYASIGTQISTVNGYIAKTPKTDPNYANLQNEAAALQGQRTTLFQGETLRSMLLNAYGWWTIGVYTTYAAYVLFVAAIGMLGALVFEVLVAARRPEKVKVAQKASAIPA
jgi:hypothetical protein